MNIVVFSFFQRGNDLKRLIHWGALIVWWPYISFLTKNLLSDKSYYLDRKFYAYRYIRLIHKYIFNHTDLHHWITSVRLCLKKIKRFDIIWKCKLLDRNSVVWRLNAHYSAWSSWLSPLSVTLMFSIIYQSINSLWRKDDLILFVYRRILLLKV